MPPFKIRECVLLVVIGIALSGCPPATLTPTSKAPTAYDRIEARMPAFLAMIDGLGAEVAALDGDCRKVAATLRKFGYEHSSELHELENLRARLSPAERERFNWEHADDERHLREVFRSLSNSCPGDADVGAARSLAGFR